MKIENKKSSHIDLKPTFVFLRERFKDTALKTLKEYGKKLEDESSLSSDHNERFKSGSNSNALCENSNDCCCRCDEEVRVCGIDDEFNTLPDISDEQEEDEEGSDTSTLSILNTGQFINDSDLEFDESLDKRRNVTWGGAPRAPKKPPRKNVTFNLPPVGKTYLVRKRSKTKIRKFKPKSRPQPRPQPQPQPRRQPQRQQCNTYVDESTQPDPESIAFFSRYPLQDLSFALYSTPNKEDETPPHFKLSPIEKPPRIREKSIRYRSRSAEHIQCTPQPRHVSAQARLNESSSPRRLSPRRLNYSQPSPMSREPFYSPPKKTRVPKLVRYEEEPNQGRCTDIVPRQPQINQSQSPQSSQMRQPVCKLTKEQCAAAGCCKYPERPSIIISRIKLTPEGLKQIQNMSSSEVDSFSPRITSTVCKIIEEVGSDLSSISKKLLQNKFSNLFTSGSSLPTPGSSLDRKIAELLNDTGTTPGSSLERRINEFLNESSSYCPNNF